MALGCHSRENGNPEPKNQCPWIPASAGMTNQKNTNLPFRNLEKSFTGLKSCNPLCYFKYEIDPEKNDETHPFGNCQ
jgi:hypothetical protein